MQLMDNPKLLAIILISAGAGVITIALIFFLPGLMQEPVSTDLLPQTINQGTMVQQETCIPQWSCTSWSACDEEFKQTRTCNDLNNCEESIGRPSLARDCIVINIEVPYLLNSVKFATGLKHFISYNESLFNVTFVSYELLGQQMIDGYKERYDLCFKLPSDLTYEESLTKELLCEGVLNLHNYSPWYGVSLVTTPNQKADVLFNDLINNSVFCFSSLNESPESLKTVCEWVVDNIKELVIKDKSLLEVGVKNFNIEYAGSMFNLTTRSYLNLESSSFTVNMSKFIYANCTQITGEPDPEELISDPQYLMKFLYCQNYIESYDHNNWWGFGVVDNSTRRVLYFNDELEKHYSCLSEAFELASLKEVCDFLADNFNDDSYTMPYSIIQTPYGVDDEISEHGVNLTTTWIKYLINDSLLYIRLKANFSDSVEIRPGEFVDFDNISPEDFTIHVFDVNNSRLLNPLILVWQTLSDGYDYQFKYTSSNVLDEFQVIFHYGGEFSYINFNTSPIVIQANMDNVTPE